MSADSQWDVQASMYTAVQADTSLTALLANRVFDYVPEESAFPYIVLGDAFAEPFDTQIGRGLNIRLTLQSFSRYQGMQEIKQIMQAVYDLLHEKNDWSIAGQSVISCRFVSSRTIVDKDGKTRSAIQNFEIITEEIL